MKIKRTRRDILLAVQNMIREQGHGAVTVRSLAEAAGCSYTNLYYYFKDLDALFREARLGLIESMIDELTAEPPAQNKAAGPPVVSEDTAADPGGDILQGFTAYVEYFLRYPAVFRFFYFYPFVRDGANEASREIEERLQGIWGSSFSPLIQSGSLRPEDAADAGKTILYAMHGLLLLRFAADSTLDDATVKKELAALVRFALRPSDPLPPAVEKE